MQSNYSCRPATSMAISISTDCWGHKNMKKARAILICSAALVLALIPALAKANYGDFSGGVAIGSSYAGVNTAPTDGLLVQGNAAFGTTTGQTGYEVTTTGGIYGTQSSSSYAGAAGLNT